MEQDNTNMYYNFAFNYSRIMQSQTNKTMVC